MTLGKYSLSTANSSIAGKSQKPRDAIFESYSLTKNHPLLYFKGFRKMPVVCRATIFCFKGNWGFLTDFSLNNSLTCTMEDVGLVQSNYHEQDEGCRKTETSHVNT